MFATAQKRTSVNDLGRFESNLDSFLSKFWGQFKVLKCSRQQKNALRSTIWVEFGSHIEIVVVQKLRASSAADPLLGLQDPPLY